MSEIERVKVEGAVDIFQTVKAARAQRPHMVYTSVSDGPRLCTLTFIGCTEHARMHALCLGLMHSSECYEFIFIFIHPVVIAWSHGL